MKRRGSGGSYKRSIASRLMMFSGFALLAFLVINLGLQGIITQFPLSREIVFLLINLLTISFITERIFKIKKVTIYEKFYSIYIGAMLILLTVIYWVSFFNKINIGSFNTLIVLTYVIVFIYTLTTIRNAHKYWFIVLSYAFAVMISIIIFGFLYWSMSIFGVGHLQFSDCSSVQSNLFSENWFYFSSVTFYALGYGDICPVRPLARLVSQIEVALGVLVNTLLIGFIFWKMREIDTKNRAKKRGKR